MVQQHSKNNFGEGFLELKKLNIPNMYHIYYIGFSNNSG